MMTIDDTYTLPADADIYRAANDLIARHGEKTIGGYAFRPGVALKIAICSLGYGWPRDDQDILCLIENDKMLLPRIENLFCRGQYDILFCLHLQNDFERIVLSR